MGHLRLTLLLFLFVSISFSLSGTTYYISTSGSDVTTGGTSGSPWKTLSYACSRVTKSGDIIHVNAGTYVETQECVLAVGVSIEGEGDVSHIISQYTTTYTSNHASILLLSTNQGTNGNQSISYIKLDGDNLSASYAIKVIRRSNVIIHHCTIINFFIGGVAFWGQGYSTDTPIAYSTGNQLYNCFMQNCGDMDTDPVSGAGMIHIGTQESMEIHDNILDESVRAQGHNGNILSAVQYFKGIKFYNNKCYKPDDDGGSWNFHLELPAGNSCYGGFEIYNNEFYGGDTPIDIGGDYVEKGIYDYTWYIHDNYFDARNAYDGSGSKQCIVIEGLHNSDVWIKNNHFNNWAHPIEICESGNDPLIHYSHVTNLWITNNLMVNCGMVGGTNWQDLVRLNFYISNKSTLSNLYIYNNVIIPNSETISSAILLKSPGSISNVNIKNNIIVGHKNATWLKVTNSGTFTGLYVTNNNLYNNSSNTPSFSGNAVSDYQFTNNVSSNPLFVSSANYNLQSSSPCIDAGVDIGLPYNGKAPDLGAFESQSGLPAPSPVFISSVVENATPSILGMTYDLSLANIVPSASAFSVKVNSVARTVNTVSISGTKVLLTLSSPVINGDVVTVSYTKPATNPIQTASGGQAATISAQTVINNVNPGTSPVYVSSAIENATPNILEMTYNLSLANIVPAASAFTVTVNSLPRSVNTVSISGTKVLLTLASPVVYGDIVTVAYTKPATNPLQTPSAGLAATISAQPVTNRVSNPAILGYINSAVGNSSPTFWK